MEGRTGTVRPTSAEGPGTLTSLQYQARANTAEPEAATRMACLPAVSSESHDPATGCAMRCGRRTRELTRRIGRLAALKGVRNLTDAWPALPSNQRRRTLRSCLISCAAKSDTVLGWGG
jgi:hypothetical protein